jgi:hypothetical protein
MVTVAVAGAIKFEFAALAYFQSSLSVLRKETSDGSELSGFRGLLAGN